MNNISFVGFDLDGTLIDSQPAILDCLKETLPKYINEDIEKIIDIVFPLEVTLDQVIERNRNRNKFGKESDDEIYDRFNLFSKFIPKSLKIVKLNGSDSQSKIADQVIKSIFNSIA